MQETIKKPIHHWVTFWYEWIDELTTGGLKEDIQVG